jgi:hypothetical protein
MSPNTNEYYDEHQHKHRHQNKQKHNHNHRNQRNNKHPTNCNNRKFNNRKILTKKIYLNRLTYLQVFSTLIIVLTAFLQAAAIATNEWFVLNVNEYIPTSKGGLWHYCYIASNNLRGQFSCLRYEELPNFAIFVNSRLYDSRILLVCSSGFCFILIIIELFGVLSLCLADTRGDLFDLIVSKHSSRWETIDRPSHMQPSTSTKTKLQQHSAKLNNKDNSDDFEMTNSARFTTSIIVNGNSFDSNNELMNQIKPTGYFAYLAIALITLVGSVMDFVLKVSGFALFDSYMNRLLSFNHVFLTYRSYSYWMMILSIVLLFFFLLFKVFSTKYVISLTRKLIYTYENAIIRNASNDHKNNLAPSSSFYASSRSQSSSEHPYQLAPVKTSNY